jgi:hypothetical protein
MKVPLTPRAGLRGLPPRAQATGNLSAIGVRDLGSYGCDKPARGEPCAGKYNYYLAEALGYFVQRLDRIAFTHGKTPVHWCAGATTLS